MRDIKCRAFDKRTNTMVDLQGFRYTGKNRIQIYYLDEDGDNVTCTCDKEFIVLMQYTGLDDKNGKEIYEGDIIPYHFNHKTLGVVKYGEYHNPFDSDNHGGHIGFYLEWNEKSSLLRVDLGYWIKVSEVIGNICKYPELLESEVQYD